GSLIEGDLQPQRGGFGLSSFPLSEGEFLVQLFGFALLSVLQLFRLLGERLQLFQSGFGVAPCFPLLVEGFLPGVAQLGFVGFARGFSRRGWFGRWLGSRVVGHRGLLLKLDQSLVSY